MGNIYYSSTDCVIKVGNREAYDIFAVQVGEQEQILPVYSWNSSFFHSVGAGNVLVSGTIIFNSKYPNYLELLATGKSLTVSAPSGASAINSIKQKITELTHPTVMAKLSGLDVVQLARLNETWNTEDSGLATDVDDPYLARQALFELWIVAPGITDKILGCRISGKATEVNAGEAKNIMYAQTFIGQRIQQAKS